MKEIKINTDSRNYPVLVGTDILSENNVKKLEELAEMSVGELMDIDSKISESEASALIMEARKPWFE